MVEVPFPDPLVALTEAKDLATVLIVVARNTLEDSDGEALTLIGRQLIWLTS